MMRDMLRRIVRLYTLLLPLLYTVIAASRVGPAGHVYAFEQSSGTFALL